MELAGLYIYAYLVGSVPATYLVGRLVKGIDLRQYGSGNLGGANVFRNVGRWWVVPPGLFEVFAKGASPVWIGLYVLDLERSSPALAGAALLGIAGHNWSLFLKFTGGRGVAEAGGAMFAYLTPLLGIYIGVGMAGWFVFRSSGTWVYISLATLPLWGWLIGEPTTLIWFTGALFGLISIKRLVGNWEPLPSGVPWRRSLFNRLVKDRDTDRYEEWVSRGSTTQTREVQ